MTTSSTDVRRGLDNCPGASTLADVLNLLGRAVLGAQVGLERAAKQLEQDLEADLCDGRVVAALAELVADEGVLGPGELVEAEDGAGLAQLEPDQVAPGIGYVRVLETEDHGHLALELAQLVDRVIAARRRRGRRVGALVRAQRPAVHVGRKVRRAGVYSGVQLQKRSVILRSPVPEERHSYRCPERQVAAQAHASETDASAAGGQAEEVVHCLVRVFIVRLKCLWVAQDVSTWKRASLRWPGFSIPSSPSIRCPRRCQEHRRQEAPVQ